jgi:hypothetical protein
MLVTVYDFAKPARLAKVIVEGRLLRKKRPGF